MAVTNAQARILAQAARIVRMQTRDPNHPRSEEYSEQLAKNRAAWQGLSKAQRREVTAWVKDTDNIADLTPEEVTAALAALEN